MAAPSSVTPAPGPGTGGSGRVVLIVLVGSWIVAVSAAGVLIPPVPLVIFLLSRMARRHPSA